MLILQFLSTIFFCSNAYELNAYESQKTNNILIIKGYALRKGETIAWKELALLGENKELEAKLCIPVLKDLSDKFQGVYSLPGCRLINVYAMDNLVATDIALVTPLTQFTGRGMFPNVGYLESSVKTYINEGKSEIHIQALSVKVQQIGVSGTAVTLGLKLNCTARPNYCHRGIITGNVEKLRLFNEEACSEITKHITTDKPRLKQPLLGCWTKITAGFGDPIIEQYFYFSWEVIYKEGIYGGRSEFMKLLTTAIERNQNGYKDKFFTASVEDVEIVHDYITLKVEGTLLDNRSMAKWTDNLTRIGLSEYNKFAFHIMLQLTIQFSEGNKNVADTFSGIRVTEYVNEKSSVHLIGEIQISEVRMRQEGFTPGHLESLLTEAYLKGRKVYSDAYLTDVRFYAASAPKIAMCTIWISLVSMYFWISK